MTPRCSLVVSIFVLRSTALWSESIANEALEADDECNFLGTEHQEACSVYQLQLRAGTRVVAAATPDPVKEARRRPLYCESLGSTAASPWCLGESSCRCESYCEHSMSKESWDFEPDCCACAGSTLGFLQVDRSFSMDSREPLKALSHPLYCKNAAFSAAPSVYCKGASTCKCSGHCKKVSAKSWGWDPTCCGCASASFVQAVAATNPPAAPQGQRRPTFCEFLPSSAESPACLEEVSTCSCSSHCNTEVPISHWAWQPTCCGCQVILQTSALEDQRQRAQSAAAAAAAPLLLQQSQQQQQQQQQQQ
eukprot:CAMPEP_0206584134 /NCGR_PEP_ID=MMETSP0325_2-20121206/35530_1 /ASSEMBLY_ACC=CAM_ASM_000347 /TAXON_ID=2866 /ORGANISM="Crypthecodinium cohnii, Strain Seligo" /LENGTH=306 /DNA_ID=CAMNT_0054091211 /DNA_START=46 /DNA_END=963 /DNA_ORIENTATION=-